MIITEKDGVDGFNLHQRIKDNEQQRRTLLADNAYFLSLMKDRELYKAVLGDEKADWNAYLGQVEVMYSRNDVRKMMQIYSKFVVELEQSYSDICDIPKSRLLVLIPIVTKETLEEWLSKARELTNLDFRDEVRIAKGLKPSEECEHTFKEYEICSTCGFKHKQDGRETL